MQDLANWAAEIYKMQLNVLSALTLDGKRLLERDWLVGAVGADAPLACTILRSGGKVVATSLHPNELVTFSVVGGLFGFDMREEFGRIIGMNPVKRAGWRPDKGDAGDFLLDRMDHPYEYSLDGKNWHKRETDPFFSDLMEWDKGFSFLSIDVRDVGTLSNYINAFRRGRKFGGIVLKGANEVFRHMALGRYVDAGGKTKLWKPPMDVEFNEEKRALVQRAYEKWLEETLLGVCEEKTLVLTSTSDAFFALPYLLAHQFRVLYPNEEAEDAISLSMGGRVITRECKVSLGDMQLFGGTRIGEDFRDLFHDRDGSFILLEGPAGRALPQTGRRLLRKEQELIDNYLKIMQQRVEFYNFMEEAFADDMRAYYPFIPPAPGSREG